MPHTQQQIIDDLAAALIQDGVAVEYEIQTEMGVIDLTTPTTAYEINASLTAESLSRAVAHIIACRDAHNPELRAVVIVGRADGNLDEAVREAEQYGVEVVILER